MEERVARLEENVRRLEVTILNLKKLMNDPSLSDLLQLRQRWDYNDDKLGGIKR